jgi:hypothetical protein
MNDRLAAYIARVVAEAPPLTHEQREKLAALLTPQATISTPLVVKLDG